MSILSTIKKLQHNDAVVRVEHTLWQAAAGAVVASLAATHGDVRVAVTAGVAAVLSAAKALVSGYLAPAAPVTAADMVEVPRPEAPVVAVTQVDTASTPAAAADPSVVPPAAP